MVICKTLPGGLERGGRLPSRHARTPGTCRHRPQKTPCLAWKKNRFGGEEAERFRRKAISREGYPPEDLVVAAEREKKAIQKPPKQSPPKPPKHIPTASLILVAFPLPHISTEVFWDIRMAAKVPVSESEWGGTNLYGVVRGWALPHTKLPVGQLAVQFASWRLGSLAQLAV